MKAPSIRPYTFLMISVISLATVSIARSESPTNNPRNVTGDRNSGLFTAAEAQGEASIANDPTIVRTRFAGVNFDLLGQKTLPSATVELNLFDDVVFTAVFDRTETNYMGSFGWIGHLEGVEYGQVVLVATNGLLAGSVTMQGTIYEVRPVGNDLHVIEEIDQTAFPPEMKPLPVPSTGSARIEDTSGNDACDEITVLVAYSPEARVADGGTAAIEATIAQAAAETNQSYVNSGLIQRINLVHTIETSTGNATNSYSTDLNALQNTSDGIFDDVDAARETYHADLVALIIENGTSCGLSYLNSTAEYAFSVIHRTCATGYYSFAHELGHNMGARHDWYIDDALNYHKGFVNVADSWRTIMAYITLCSDQGRNCSRLQYWSNPDMSYGSPPDPMGIISTGPMNCQEDTLTPDPSTCAADNRMALNNTCSTVANFRSGVPNAMPWIPLLLLPD